MRPVPAVGVAAARERVRAVVPPLDEDREMASDIEAAVGLVRSGAVVDLVG